MRRIKVLDKLLNARFFVFAGIVLAFTCTIIFAQQNVEPVKPVLPESEKKDTEVIGRADHMRNNWGDKRTVIMKGNVKFTQGDTVITSDEVNYDDKTKVAISPGKIKITNPECDIVGDKGSAFFKKRLGIVEGNVSIFLKPKNDSKAPKSDSPREKFKQPTTITCAKVEYLYKDKITTATGGVIFIQANRRAKAEKAVFDSKKEILTLSGGVSAIDEKGQTFNAPGTVVISLKEGDEWMEAQNANSTFKIDLGEEEKEQSKQ